MRIDSGGNVGIGSGPTIKYRVLAGHSYRVIDSYGPEIIPGWPCIHSDDAAVADWIEAQSHELWRRVGAEPGVPLPAWILSPKLYTLLVLRWAD